ncbi:MAG TPA: Hsp20/alpha crystallin family protein [Gaiellaceae bacterium]|jgi:HSP20 family protein|nr:Hsp20/alpha crystallin family protein [Gaiellaceae bacterium]
MSQLLPERRSRLAPERWEPLSELEQVSERMRRLLDQTFGEVGWPSAFREGAWSPPVDIEETDDTYFLEAELPGVKREDVAIEHVGNELTIKGEIVERERKGVVRRRARRTGRYEYRVTLPEQVDGDKIDANLKDGVLTVRVPKSQKAQRRKIEVKS